MPDEKTVTIPVCAVICAARHFAAAHESACTGQPVDWGDICSKCSEVSACRGDWMTAAASVFDVAAVYPQFVRPVDA